MTKNFIEQHETYKDSEGEYWTCVAVSLDTAWCVLLDGDPNRACAFHLDGTPRSGLSKVCTLLPPGPRIAKNDRSLCADGSGEYFVARVHHPGDPSGTLHTHEDANVALFVPEKISKDYLRDVLVEILEEVS